MGSAHEDLEEDVVAKAVRAASIAQSARKKAERVAKEALEVARKEMKRKGKLVELRKSEARKKTMRSYFQTTWGMGGGQPLSLVFDGAMPEVPSAEPNSEPEYPSDNDLQQLVNGKKGKSVSLDTAVTPRSSSGSGDTVVLSAKSPLITLSEESDELDNANLADFPDDSEGSETDSHFQSPPQKRAGTARNHRSRTQKRYDRHRKFQTIWAAKLPWAEGMMASDGILHMVKCKVCSAFERKPMIMVPKSDTLFKHDGKRTAKKDMPQFKVKAGEEYVATNCRHRKNLRLYAAKPPATVLEQINHCTTLESSKKRVQFATLFQLLSDGRPMVEFESRLPLYKLLSVPDLPSAHWCDSSGWIMASYMYRQVLEETRRLIESARYLAVTVDEVTAVDNSSFLSIHCYIVQDWVRVPLLVSLQRVQCSPNAENLTELIMAAVTTEGGLDSTSVAKKLLSFGANGASVLQGTRSGVTLQIKDKHASFLNGVHCVDHRCNLAFKALSSLGIFSDIEKLLSVTYTYFSKSPKRYSEFKQLADLTETKGLKMLRNVQTRWVSLIKTLRRLLSEYRTLIYKMKADLHENVKAEVCQRDLYCMYKDNATSYNTDEFWSFNNLLDCSHEQIHIKWVTGLSDDAARLTFICHGEQIHAEHKAAHVDRQVWTTLLTAVKAECTTRMLVLELDARFPAHHIMNAFGILYPQYWCSSDAEEMFHKHLRTVMDAYGHGKILGEGEKKLLIPPLVDRDALISQRALFKTCMKSKHG